VRLPKLFLLIIVPLLVAVAGPILWYSAPWESPTENSKKDLDADDPDLPSGSTVDKAEYLRLRNEQIAFLRGLDTAQPDSRGRAVRTMEREEGDLAQRRKLGLAGSAGAVLAPWHPLGPSPIPNGSTSYSGRVTAIAIDPTDANIVYVGTAQGGLFRSLDGGVSWTPMLDNALTLAIGSVAVAPSDHTTVFVGTGEANFSADSFFGVGIYRITNATSSPTISGPLNLGTGGNDVFTGRTVSKIIVHPTDPNTLFVSTGSGGGGISGSTTGLALPARGVFRTTNAMDASPTFTKLAITGSTTDRTVVDLAIEPDNPNNLVASVISSSGVGGLYRSTNALAASPTFTQSLSLPNESSSASSRSEFAVQKSSGVWTIYAASGNSGGTLYKSVDGGATFSTVATNSFCGGQCFYNIAVGVDPGDPSKVYLGGYRSGASPNFMFARSSNGGVSFTESSVGLHPDTHAIAVAPSNSNVIYTGNDGGVWKSVDGGSSWSTLNNSTFSATQFQSIAVHPTDRFYTLGGTQDNGTEFLAPNGTTWIWSDGGDGGFTAIDQNATDTTNVVAYHTYFNQTANQIGFVRATSTVSPGDPNWNVFLGCGGTANGIDCADATLFYAPLVLGPNAAGSTGNTIYFGTSKLYRSANRGATMTAASQVMPIPAGNTTASRISAIAISPQNDDVRLIGTSYGQVFLSTTAGATTMTDVTGPIPSRYIGRVAIDPTNANIAYVTLNGYGLASGQHVWKTTNLLSGSPTWTSAGSGIPDVPVNAFVIDSANPQSLYAGTDIGVYQSTDSGVSWVPFSTGLPRVAVFGMAIQPTSRTLRIATHGRGIWEADLPTGTGGSTHRTPFDFDGDGKTDVSIFRPGTSAEWWYLRSSDNGVRAAGFGTVGDQPAPADFTGDGKTDIAFFRPSTGQWFVIRSEDSSFYGFPFGGLGDVPVPADYDGDGKADAAVFRPSSGTWFILRSSDSGVTIAQFGVSTDNPIPADYDGDGKADLAVQRPNGAAGTEWWILRSTAGLFAATFGSPGDKAVIGDWTGDGKADVGFFRPSTGSWFVLRSEDVSFFSFPFGTATDTPAPGDYDGDGKIDAAVFRSSTGQWFVNRSSGGVDISSFGSAGDQPVAGAYVR